MAEIETLEIIIDVIDQFEEELDRLLLMLAEVEAAAERVDNITIDVDVRGESELAATAGYLAALQAADFDDLDVDVGVDRSGGGGGRTASRAADTTSGLFGDLSLRMTDVHNALAQLVPLLLVVVGAIPALYGAFVALAGAAVAAAAALSALTAFGALGLAAQMGGGDISEGFMEMVREVRDDFLDAFMPLADRLAPLFADGLDGLERFFEAVASEGDALVALSDEARAFGQYLIDTLPAVLGDMAALGEAASETFVLIDMLAREMGLFGAFAGFLADVLPAVTQLAGALTAMAPALLGLSIGFLQVVSGALALFHVLGQLVGIFGVSTKQLGLLIGTLLGAWTATMLLNSAIVGALAKSMVQLGTRVLALISTYTSYSASAVIAKLATIGLSKALLGLIGIATLGVGAFIGLQAVTATTGQMFGSMSGQISDATEQLRQFQRQQNRMSAMDNPYRNPDVPLGAPSSRFRGDSGVTTVIEGDADEQTAREQTHNGLYRMERPRRG